MARTKIEIIQDKIDANIEDIYAMEIVRDRNLEIDTTTAKEQVNAAEKRIADDEENLTWLRAYKAKCESAE